MTDVSGAFELRKVNVRFVRLVGSGVTEDAAAFTFDLAKITAGAIDPAWTTANYAACEARLDTWWGLHKSFVSPFIQLDGYRWYKDGPTFAPADRADGPANPAQRITARAVAATGSGAGGPPQLAGTVTKVVSERKRWGRVYLPTPDALRIVAGTGRFSSAYCSNALSQMVALFNGFRADGFRPVVFSRGRSAHLSKAGGTIADHTATAYEILSLQVDDLPDIVRSRRWVHPTIRSVTALT